MELIITIEKWEADVGHISDAQWDFVMALTPVLSPSEAQRLSIILTAQGL